MSTIEDILKREVETADSEGAALAELAAFLRDAAVRLPDGSRLARHFAVSSLQFDKWSCDRGHEAQMGAITMDKLMRDIEQDDV